jgi:fructose-specific component phosphotransferase system IIB-like protein
VREGCIKKCWGRVVFGRNYRYDEIMSGKEVKILNKSHRVAMAQALLAELSEATARYGANNDGVRRLHRMVRDMVAQLLA